MALKPEPPLTKRVPVERSLHGETVADAYAWLRERDTDEVLAHLTTENAYVDQVLGHLDELRETLFLEIKSRVQETDLSVPARKGPFWYLTRTTEGAQYPVSCRRRESPDGPEEVLLDCNAIAGESDYFALGAHEVSPDHQLLAYSTDFDGSEQYELHFRDVSRGADLPDTVASTSYGSAWSRDSACYFYTRLDDAMRPYQLWRHRIGTESDADALVFQEDDERFSLQVEASRSDDLILVTLQSQITSEGWFLDATDPEGALTCVRPREEGVEYWVEHARGPAGKNRGELVIVSTKDAPNGRVLLAPIDSPDDTRELLPHRADVKLDDVDSFSTHFAVWCRTEGTSGVTLLSRDGAEANALEFDEPVRTVDAGANLEYETTTLRFEYESLVTPASIYDHDLETGERRLLKQQPVLGGYDPSEWESRREWAVAPDGTRVPISLVHRKGAARDGSSPLVLYGYGAYESNSDPWFSVARLSLLERGVTFAVAHVRGGGEMGRHWYEEGKLAAKHNTFDDFVACAEHLVDAGYTAPDRLAIRGGSAGGLLVGAALNLRPELFRAVVAEVPFVDVVNTMLDESLPLTIGEWEEWGNPSLAEHYGWMRAYAPYENIRATAYPRVLATAGLNDPRVQYWEPAKWVAALREQTTGDEPFLLKTEMGAGHGGSSGRYDAWRDEALVLAFLLDALAGTTDLPAAR
jgi:oligopeptidase B